MHLKCQITLLGVFGLKFTMGQIFFQIRIWIWYQPFWSKWMSSNFTEKVAIGCWGLGWWNQDEGRKTQNESKKEGERSLHLIATNYSFSHLGNFPVGCFLWSKRATSPWPHHGRHDHDRALYWSAHCAVFCGPRIFFNEISLDILGSVPCL